MKAFNSLVLPSSSEGFGMVLLEAMCAEIPIIASSAGGIPEVLHTQKYIFKSQSVEQLRNAMLNIFNEQPQTQYQYFQEYFCIEKHYASYRNIIETLKKST